jgi:hypothetical protein
MYSRSIQDLIRERVSIRSYDQQKIVEKEKIDELILFCSNLGPSPFGDKVHFFTFNLDDYEPPENFVHTYGSIKNISIYFGGTIASSERSLESYGYLFEQAILKAYDLGISTCWLDYYILPPKIEQKLVKNKEIIPAISPLGYASTALVTKDTIFRSILRSSKRRQFSDIFFDKSLDKPLNAEKAGEYAIPFEMLRFAPSAGNRQPWRVILDNDIIHFYLDMSLIPERYQKKSLYLLDLGIALSHFELTCTELNLRGRYVSISKEALPESSAQLHYGISWKAL